MKCKDCGKEVTEEEATTYIQIGKGNMIEKYKSILCQDCRKNQLEEIRVNCECGKKYSFLFKKTLELQRYKKKWSYTLFRSAFKHPQ